jgi:hypothetical protein
LLKTAVIPNDDGAHASPLVLIEDWGSSREEARVPVHPFTQGRIRWKTQREKRRAHFEQTETIDPIPAITLRLHMKWGERLGFFTPPLDFFQRSRRPRDDMVESGKTP